MSRRPTLPDFIEEELLRVPMTLDAVIDAVVDSWRQRLPPHRAVDGDPARVLRQHGAELIQEAQRSLRESTHADLQAAASAAATADLSPGLGLSGVPGLMRAATPAGPGQPDLSLIDEDDVAVDIEIVRCTQAIKQVAEVELRDLHTYTSALVHDLNVARDTNPFGPERFVRALWRGVQRLPLGRAVQVAFMHEAARPLSQAMRKAYASASQRLQGQGVAPAAYRTIVFGGGTAWGADLARQRPGEDPTPAQPSLAARAAAAGGRMPGTPVLSSHLPMAHAASPGAAATAAALGGPPAQAAQAAELLARLFEALQQERGLAPPCQALLARLQPSLLRLAQADTSLLAAYDHAAWRFMDQLAFDIECTAPVLLARQLALCAGLVDHLAAEQPISGASFTWAIVRLAAARRHGLEQALEVAMPQIDRLHRMARHPASAASGAAPLDVGTLDTVPADLLPEPDRPAPAAGAFGLLQAATPGTHLRCHLQGRWRHLMALWFDPDSELLLLQEPASGRLWALRENAMLRLLAEALARPLRVRSLVRRAADRLLNSG